MIKPSKKAVSRNRMIKALDAVARREIVEIRDGNWCQRCNYHADMVTIQWAHVQTRRYLILRWEPCNSLALCDRCHVWMDQHKVESYEWFSKKWPERWANIQRVLQMPCKTSLAWLRERYAELNHAPKSTA